jgi:hypothetical protein
MKKSNWPIIGMMILAGVFVVSFLTYSIYETFKTPNPNKGLQTGQRTVDYIGFDGKPHQAIIVYCGTNNWVIVEKR